VERNRILLLLSGGGIGLLLTLGLMPPALFNARRILGGRLHGGAAPRRGAPNAPQPPAAPVAPSPGSPPPASG
jgi:hypothetical protein